MAHAAQRGQAVSENVPELPPRVAEHVARALLDQLRRERPGHVIELIPNGEADAILDRGSVSDPAGRTDRRRKNRDGDRLN